MQNMQKNIIECIFTSLSVCFKIGKSDLREYFSEYLSKLFSSTNIIDINCINKHKLIEVVIFQINMFHLW